MTTTLCRQVTKTPRTIGDHANAVQMHYGATHFQDKLVRDAVAAVLTGEGLIVKKTTSRGSVFHPEYVQDFVGTYETGFGNTDYQTYWKVLYNLEVVR